MFLGKLIMGIGYTAVKSKIKVGRGKILGWGVDKKKFKCRPL